MKSFVYIITLSILLFFCVRAKAEEPKYVVVDPSDKYATTYAALPKSVPEADIQKLKSKMTGLAPISRNGSPSSGIKRDI